MDIRVGSIVCSRAGRDKGRFFAVLSLSGDFAAIADGDLRKTERPKRKKLRHLAPTNWVLEEEQLSADKQLYDAIHTRVGARQKED